MITLRLCSLLTSIVVATTLLGAQQEPITFELNVTANRHEKSPLVVMLTGELSTTLQEVAAVIKKDFEFGGQFAVDIKDRYQEPKSAADITALSQAYPLAIFLKHNSSDNSFDWHIYETTSALQVAGKKYHARGNVQRGWAHNIADTLWPLLTGQDGFFSTKIAYCKEVPAKRGKKFKHIYMADYDGSNPEVIVATPTINMAPRFNQDKENPLLFFSESANENIRLKVANMHKRAKVASDFDGVNMLPVFSGDGSKVVYCASRGRGNCQLYYYDKDGIKPLTQNSGNNISPTLSEDANTLYFCSDYEGKPQIYCYNSITGIQRAITTGQESCFSPAYCNKKQLLAYAKMIKGVLQLFIYNERTGEHTQLTFDNENKDECSWSPCGNYLLFCAEKRSKERIAMINVISKEQRYLTPDNFACSYPTWSPVYNQYPVVS